VESADIHRIIDPEFSKKLVEKFKKIGFLHVAVDMEGYTTGSMNRALKDRPSQTD